MWVSTPIAPSSAYSADTAGSAVFAAVARTRSNAGGGERRREDDRRPHPLVSERALVVLEVDLERKRRCAQRRRGGERLLHPPRADIAQEMSSGMSLGVGSFQLEPVAGPREVGPQRSVYGLEHAVEEQRARPRRGRGSTRDGGAGDRAARVSMDGGAAVRRQVERAASRAPPREEAGDSRSQRVTSACRQSTAPAASICSKYGSVSPYSPAAISMRRGARSRSSRRPSRSSDETGSSNQVRPLARSARPSRAPACA